MASDYYLDGIGVAVEEVRECIRDLFPEKPLEERDVRFVTERQRNKLTRQRITAKAKETARIPLRWRRKFAKDWKLKEVEVVKATNIIMRELEAAMQAGHPIHISHFGNFFIRDLNTSDGPKPRVVFVPDSDWVDSLNTPRGAEDLGILHRVDRDGRIVPRRIESA